MERASAELSAPSYAASQSADDQIPWQVQSYAQAEDYRWRDPTATLNDPVMLRGTAKKTNQDRLERQVTHSLRQRRRRCDLLGEFSQMKVHDEGYGVRPMRLNR